MGLRDLTLEDLPQIVGLFQRAFRDGDPSGAEEIGAFLRRTLFETPWADARPSLVYEAKGKVVGLLGIVVRPMTFQDRRIDVAITNNFMVEPGSGLAGVVLMKRFLAGSHDLAFAESNETSRQVMEGLGAVTSRLYSIHWNAPLRPARFAANRLRGAARVLGAPVAGLADGLLTRLPGPFRRRPPDLEAAPATAERLLSCIEELTASFPLRPRHDLDSLRWLLDLLARKTARGEFRTAILRDREGALQGWYLYFLKRGDVSQVVQVGGRPAAYGDVLDHLFHDAWRGGAAALAGRIEPRFVQELAARGCLLARRNRWVVLHSPHADVLAAFHRGDAYVSRLEGEWWISYP